jgi:hypothetical protein
MTSAVRRFVALSACSIAFLFGCSTSEIIPDPTIDSSPPPVDAAPDQSVVPDVRVDRGPDTSPDAVDAGAPDAPIEAAPVDANDGSAIGDAACGDACPSWLCLDGACVECTADEHCGGSKPRCDVPNRTCVPCLPGAKDNCPAGQYCTGAFTCAPGCKGNAACASGVCNANHECEHCQGDLECSAGRVCGSGTCSAPCTGQGPSTCAAGFECCGQHCVDPKRDIAHCGACTGACRPEEFCASGAGPSSCQDATFAHLCANTKTTRVLDGFPLDDAAALVLQNAITTSCNPAPMAASSPKDATGWINPTTGQPVAGPGDLLTVAGGTFVQKVVTYLDAIGATPVYLVMTPTSWEYHERAPAGDGGADAGAGPIVASLRFDQMTPQHDLIAIQLVRDASGSLLLIAFGQEPESTAAAAWYVANVLLPNRANYNQSWYVYEWFGKSDAGPTGADDFDLLASGP